MVICTALETVAGFFVWAYVILTRGDLKWQTEPFSMRSSQTFRPRSMTCGRTANAPQDTSQAEVDQTVSRIDDILARIP